MYDFDQALAYCQRTQDIATVLGDREMQRRSRHDLGQLHHDLGDYPRAIECFRSVNTSLQDDQLSQRVMQPSVRLPVQNRVYLTLCLADVGAFAEGKACGEEALHIAEVVDRPYERLAASTRVGYLHLQQGNFAQAIPFLERALALSQDADMPIFFRIAVAYLAPAYAWSGRAADALALLEQVGGDDDMSRTFIFCAEAYLLANRVEDAHRHAAEVLAQARDHKTRGLESRALWLLGESVMQGDSPAVEQAEVHYQQALALAEELGMRPLQAHCRLGLGRLYGQTRRDEQACLELSAAMALYRSMDMRFWLPQAEAALAQVQS